MAATISSLGSFSRSIPRLCDSSPDTAKKLAEISSTSTYLIKLIRESYNIANFPADMQSEMETRFKNIENSDPYFRLEHLKILFILSRFQLMEYEKRSADWNRLKAELRIYLCAKTMKEVIRNFFSKGEGLRFGKEMLKVSLLGHSLKTIRKIYPCIYPSELTTETDNNWFLALNSHQSRCEMNGVVNLLKGSDTHFSIEYRINTYIRMNLKILHTDSSRASRADPVSNEDSIFLQVTTNLETIDVKEKTFINRGSCNFTNNEVIVLTEIENTVLSELFLEFGVNPDLEHFTICRKERVANFALFFNKGYIPLDSEGATPFHNLFKSKEEPWTLNHIDLHFLNKFLESGPNPFIRSSKNPLKEPGLTPLDVAIFESEKTPESRVKAKPFLDRLAAYELDFKNKVRGFLIPLLPVFNSPKAPSKEPVLKIIEDYMVG